MAQVNKVSKRRGKTNSKKTDLAKVKKDIIIYGFLIFSAIVVLFLLFLFLDKLTGAETRF